MGKRHFHVYFLENLLTTPAPKPDIDVNNNNNSSNNNSSSSNSNNINLNKNKAKESSNTSNINPPRGINRLSRKLIFLQILLFYCLLSLPNNRAKTLKKNIFDFFFSCNGFIDG